MNEARPIRDTPDNRRQLSLITGSKTFRRRHALTKLLRYLATATMEGRDALLSQEDIGQALSFDGVDTGVTVRSAVSRLRAALLDYYNTEAGPEEIRIELPPRRFFITVTPSARTSKVQPAESRPPISAPKIIAENDITGQQGVTLIAKACLDMGFLWHPTGLEAGIDGYIEIRLATGEVTNCIIQVQSKATSRAFEKETDRTFEFRCTARDLDYWLGGNAPVILVRSRPNTNEAFWVSIKDYFRDPARRKTGKVLFDKIKDRFDPAAKDALQRLALRADSGLYLPTQPKREVIYSNLLGLAPFPTHYYTATTEYRTPPEAFARLRELTSAAQGEWILHSKQLTSFHDLSARPWTELVDPGTIECHDTAAWARTVDAKREQQFVYLLNRCLKEQLFRKGIRFSREAGYYYFRAPQDLSNIDYAYASREHKTSRAVFKAYAKKSDRTQVSYYRHSAFSGRFARYGGAWYLHILPTYHFTRDGDRPSRYAGDLLSGIKRLENNQAVHGQVVMWAHILAERSLFDSGPHFIDFSGLQQFELNAGIDDDAWLKREDAESSQLAIDDQQSTLL